jgi:hypothetical protein
MTNIEKWEEEYDKIFDSGKHNGYYDDGKYVQCGKIVSIKSFIRTLLQSEQTRIAEEVEKKDFEIDIPDPNKSRFDAQNIAVENVRQQVLSIIKQGK